MFCILMKLRSCVRAVIAQLGEHQTKDQKVPGPILGHGRVGHCVLFHSERSVLFCSLKERNVIFHSFDEFLATYGTQKNTGNVLLQRM